MFSHFIDHYSGGRIHAWFIAVGLAHAGHAVTVFTDRVPGFIDDFDLYPANAKIKIVTLEDFRTPAVTVDFDLIVVIPDLRYDFRYYLAIGQFAARTEGRVILVNFETPNWKAEISGYPMNLTAENGSWEVSRYADVILSSTHESDRHARSYFTAVLRGTRFEVCYPPIHQAIADTVSVPAREKRIVIITRFFPEHKNALRLFELVCPEMRGYEVVLVIGVGEVPLGWLDHAKAAFQGAGATLIIKNRLAENEKFRLLKSARLTLFPSTFEGFGLPPVESLYCGTPCVCFDLPVLREVNQAALIYCRTNDFRDFRSRTAAFLSHPKPDPPPLARPSYDGAFQAFAARLDQIIQQPG